MSTVTHVTHEALQKVGGIGAVLEGLLGTRAYGQAIRRTFLVGPTTHAGDASKLASLGELLYDTRTGFGSSTIRSKLDPIARTFDVNLLYGTRSFGGDGLKAEVVLIDPAHLNRRIDENFKYALFEHFGLQSDRFEAVDDYQLYVGIAEPAIETIRALLGRSQGPHFVLAHEYMGMPAALKAQLVDRPKFRTVFYAHEVSTVRPVVESSPGHDTMFYNVMARCLAKGTRFADVFGDPSGYYRHALITQARHLDAVFAVGELVRDELRFIDSGFEHVPVDVVHNGLESRPVRLDRRNASRERLTDYAENLIGHRPDAVFTHVARPVVSKGFWRDLLVLDHLDGMLGAQGRSAVLFLLTSAAGVRDPGDVSRMEADYGWPLSHREGAPDLVGYEVSIWEGISAFNASAQAVRAILVNQFGWDTAHCGTRMPGDMTFDDLRMGSDVEFGQSIYEPFGIAQLEPLGAGAICVVSNVCGCTGVLDEPDLPKPLPNVVVADYVSTISEESDTSLEALLAVGRHEREQIEIDRSRDVAHRIMQILPQSDEAREALSRSGGRAAEALGWERMCERRFLPGLEAAARHSR